MRGNFDLDDGSVERLAGDGAFREGNARGAGDALNRAKHIHERGQVVRPHVEHRPAAGFVVELRRGMPHLMPPPHHKGRHRDRFANRAAVNHLSAGLMSAAQKRVRERSRFADSFACASATSSFTLRLRHGERLFDVDVLSRL